MKKNIFSIRMADDYNHVRARVCIPENPDEHEVEVGFSDAVRFVVPDKTNFVVKYLKDDEVLIISDNFADDDFVEIARVEIPFHPTGAEVRQGLETLSKILFWTQKDIPRVRWDNFRITTSTPFHEGDAQVGMFRCPDCAMPVRDRSGRLLQEGICTYCGLEVKGES